MNIESVSIKFVEADGVFEVGEGAELDETDEDIESNEDVEYDKGIINRG